MRSVRIGLFAASIVAVVAVGIAGWALWRPGPDIETMKARFARPEAPPFPSDNAFTPEKARLGEALFFDPRLSGANDLACAGCHLPEKGWEDGRPTAVGTGGKAVDRHTPTLWNLAWGRTFFWDGRARSLEQQAAMPIEAPNEMNQPLAGLVAELRAIPGYRDAFAEAFPQAERPVSADNLRKAIATFERTLVQPMTPFDRWVAGDAGAIGDSARRGFRLFNGKARCVECHGGWNFTNGAFHDIGLPATEDKGRGPVIDVAEVNYAFKTPTLRDVTRRAPYMHDGSLPTMEAVIAHYEGAFERRPTLSPDLEAIDLSEREERDLIAFLKTLETPAAARLSTVPELPE